MKIGVKILSREWDPSPASLRTWIEIIESSGADYTVMGDHILGVAPEQQKTGWDKAWVHQSSHRTSYTFEDRWHEPFVTMGFIAAISRLELATGVLVLPQRNTALVAKQAAQLDILCEGRLRLGVGVGWNAAEFESVGQPFEARGSRMEEQIRLLRQLWTDDVVTFSGRFHTVNGAGIAPRPIQQPIPVWIGGGSLGKGLEAATKPLQRIGAMADGWCTDSATYPDDTTRSAINIIRASAITHGRDPKAIGIDARMYVLKLGLEKFSDQVGQWRELGATHISIDAAGLGLQANADGAATLKRLVEIARGRPSET